MHDVAAVEEGDAGRNLAGEAAGEGGGKGLRLLEQGGEGGREELEKQRARAVGQPSGISVWP